MGAAEEQIHGLREKVKDLSHIKDSYTAWPDGIIP